ncbi:MULTISPECIES: WD40 repeat domain-containing protein [Anaeromyxobacter]|uniref:WD40 repeat domain-containing protein n=1 Tax=Anaeromyxobacter TaxID=161492 RepID=UPI001F5733DA|nr:MULTISPECIES: WD40 repeat domain-containing protein [unclassified Anaeromyxobacter]
MTRRGWVGLGAVLCVLAVACGGSGSSDKTPSGGTGGDGGGGGGTTPTPPPVTPPPPEQPPGFQFGTQGPWPVANAIYGAKDGIEETPVVAMTTDEAQNRWVATPRALYLLRPGETTFRRFDEVDGLHLGAITGRTPGPVGWAKYCDKAPIPDDRPCNGDLVWGGAASEGIKAIVGGGKNEVFIGYDGDQTRGADGEPIPCLDADDPVGWKGFDYCDPLRHSGKVDWVRLAEDGTLQVVRFDLLSNRYGAKYWHDRTISRLAYDHFVHPGTLYTGANHGVSILFPAKYREPAPGEWFDIAYSEYMGDHQHARVCYHEVCGPDGESASMRVGEWLGLAIDAEGRLWHAGKWTAGRITWVDDAYEWHHRYGAAFDAAFGDPWMDGARTSPPVFDVTESGDPVYLTAVSACPDGRVWFSSRGPTTGNAAARKDAVAVWDGKRFAYLTASQVGLGEAGVRDLACLPDGRLAIAGYTTGLSVYDPATGTSRPIRAASGLIPSDRVSALEVDRMVVPPALHVATASGAAVLRTLP